MTFEEIESYIALSSTHSICVDIRHAEEFPGYVRRVILLAAHKVRLEFEQFGYDEAGVYFSGQYANEVEMIENLERFLGAPLANWQNFSRSGFYPEIIAGKNPTDGATFLAERIANNSVPLPSGTLFKLIGGTFWQSFQRQADK